MIIRWSNMKYEGNKLNTSLEWFEICKRVETWGYIIITYLNLVVITTSKQWTIITSQRAYGIHTLFVLII